MSANATTPEPKIRRPWWKSKKILVVVIPAAGLVLAAAVTGIFNAAKHDSSGSPITNTINNNISIAVPAAVSSASPSSYSPTSSSVSSTVATFTRSSTSVPSPIAAPVVTPKPTPAQSTTAAAPPLVTTYLADLTPIGESPDTTKTPILASMQNDVQSISTDTGGCARDMKNSFVYPLSGKYLEFTADVALQSNYDKQNPNPKAQVEILADNVVVMQPRILAANDVVHVKFSVAGRSTLTLTQVYLGPNRNTCSEAGVVFFGNAALTSRG